MKRAEYEISDVALARSECEARPRTLRSSDAKVTSWRAPLADVPNRAFARIEAIRASRIDGLEAAFAGPGAPSGILATDRNGSGLLVEFDTARTSPALVDALVAAETCAYPSSMNGRALPADDASLTAFCSELLLEPDLDTSRLIETYLVPMLNESP